MNNSNKIYITCLASKEVIQVNASTGLVEARIPVSKFPYAVLVDTSSIQVSNFWKNTPDYLFEIDNKPHQFYLTDPILVEKNTTSFTNTILVADVSDPTYASIPNLHNATIFKNGVDVGLRTIVVEGDQLKLRYTTPNSYSTRMEIPLYVGPTNDWFIAETRPIDDILDPFYFNDIFDAELNSEYISNEIEITDIDVEVRLVFNIDYGTIILNGVDTGVSSTIVQLGDKIRIRAVSDADYCGRKFISASCAGYTNVWSIINIKDLTKETKYLIGESNKSLFDFIDGSDKEAKNYVEKIVSDSVVTSLNLDSPPLSNGVTGDIFYVADYINSRIIKVDLLDGVEQVISTAPDKPYKVAWKDGNVFYSCPDTNKISNLDKSIVISVSKPKTLIFNEYNELLVACDDGVVVCRRNIETLQYEFYGKIKTSNTSLCDLAVVSTGISQEKSCAQFTGTEYVNVSSHPSFNLGSDNWTFEAFVKIDSDQGNNRVVLFSNAGISGNQVNSNFSFYLEPVSIDPTNDRYKMACDLYYVEDNRVAISAYIPSDDDSNFYKTGAKLTAIDDVELEKDRWYHVVYTRENVSEVDRLRFFVNGVPSTNIQVNFSFLKEGWGATSGLSYGVRTIYNTNYTNTNGILPKIQSVINTSGNNETVFAIGLSGVDPLVGKLRGSSTSFKGLLSNVRLTKGVAVYNSIFAAQFFQLPVNNATSLFMYPDNATTSQNFSQKTIATVPYDGSSFVFNELGFKTEILLQDVFNLIYATDISSNSVHEIEGYFHVDNAIKRTRNVHELPYSIAKDANNLYVANFGHSSISTINISTFTSTTTFLPAGFSFPIDIEVDGSKLYIAPYRETYLLEYDGGVFTDILLAGNPIAVNKVNQSIWTTELYGEVLDNEDVGIADFISPIVIPDQFNALFDTFYESQLQTIAGQTVKPIPLYLETYSDATIIKNGVDVGKSTSFVVGDTFKIKAKSLSFFKKPKTVGLYSCRFTTSFTIITIADLEPDIMIFDPYLDATLRSRIYTQELPITGIDPSEDLLIEIIGYGDSITQLIEPQLIVNGEYTMSNTATVRLGDTIGFSVLVKGITWNGDRLPVKIKTAAGFEFAFIDVYTGFLEGPIRETKPRERKEDAEYSSVITYSKIEDFAGYEIINRKYDKPSINLTATVTDSKQIQTLDYTTELGSFRMESVSTTPELSPAYVIYDIQNNVELIASSEKYFSVPDYSRTESKTVEFVNSDFMLLDKVSSVSFSDYSYERTQSAKMSVIDSDYSRTVSAKMSDVDSNYDRTYTASSFSLDSVFDRNISAEQYQIDSVYSLLARSNTHDVSPEYNRNLVSFVEANAEYMIFTNFVAGVISDYEHIPLYSFKLVGTDYTRNTIAKKLIGVEYERTVSAIAEYMFAPVQQPQATDKFIDTTVIRKITPYFFTEPAVIFKPFMGNEIPQDFLMTNPIHRSINTQYIHNSIIERVVQCYAMHCPITTRLIGSDAIHREILTRLIGSDATQASVLSRLINMDYQHREVLDKLLSGKAIHFENLTKIIGPDYLHRNVLDKILGGNPHHREVLEKILTKDVSVYPELNKMLTANAVPYSLLTKIVEANVIVYPELDKLISGNAIPYSVLTKVLETTAIVYPDLVKSISPDIVHRALLNKIIERVIVSYPQLTKAISPSIQLSRYGIILLTRNVEIDRNAATFAERFASVSEKSNLYVQKQYVLRSNEYVDHKLTIEEKRLYATAEEAIQAGIDAGFTGVRAYRTEDGAYFWYKPSKTINAYCTVGGRVYPVGWYMHGG